MKVTRKQVIAYLTDCDILEIASIVVKSTSTFADDKLLVGKIIELSDMQKDLSRNLFSLN